MGWSIVNVNGKYLVHLEPKWFGDRLVMPDFQEEMLKEEIDKLVPKDFFFKEGLFSSRLPSYGVWVQKKIFWQNAINCEVSRDYLDYRTPDGKSICFPTYYIRIWPTVGKLLRFDLGNKGILKESCRFIAREIDDRYDIKYLVKMYVECFFNGQWIESDFKVDLTEREKKYLDFMSVATANDDAPLFDPPSKIEKYAIEVLKRRMGKNAVKINSFCVFTRDDDKEILSGAPKNFWYRYCCQIR